MSGAMHAQSADMDQAAEDGSNGERGPDEQESTVVVDIKKAKVVVRGLPSMIDHTIMLRIPTLINLTT